MMSCNIYKVSLEIQKRTGNVQFLFSFAILKLQQIKLDYSYIENCLIVICLLYNVQFVLKISISIQEFHSMSYA